MHFDKDIYRSLFFNGDGTLPYADGQCYFDALGRGQPWQFMDEYVKQLEAVRATGCISLPTANHDFQRPRCGRRGWDGLRPLWTFFMTQAGPPTIYYGDEIGMAFVENTAPKEGSTLIGVTAPNAGSANGERAGTRTPMQWDASANAGFSTAASEQLYIALDPDPARPNVADQHNDPESLLNFVRNLINIRKANPALGAQGDFTFLNPRGLDYPMVYQRKVDGQCCVIAINPCASDRELTLEYSCQALRPLIQHGVKTNLGNGNISFFLSSFSYGIFEVV
jgi:maltose alpha-D-glucosyltransferase/alpha-amylase